MVVVKAVVVVVEVVLVAAIVMVVVILRIYEKQLLPFEVTSISLQLTSSNSLERNNIKDSKKYIKDSKKIFHFGWWCS